MRNQRVTIRILLVMSMIVMISIDVSLLPRLSDFFRSFRCTDTPRTTMAWAPSEITRQTVVTEEKKQHEPEQIIHNDCKCELPAEWHAQSGQDEYLFRRLFFQQALCCKGVFVEFGARNGVSESNTYAFEKYMGWTGLLFEVDPKEANHISFTRPKSDVVNGPVCPSDMNNVTILFSNIAGWTGSEQSIDPTRKAKARESIAFPCHHLATELRQRKMHRVDYMTIDTEGSEVDIVEDFPWNEFDIRVVQVEQLSPQAYRGQREKKNRLIVHMRKFGYKLLGAYTVSENDTEDMIFTRNIDEYIKMTGHFVGTNPQMQDAYV